MRSRRPQPWPLLFTVVTVALTTSMLLWAEDSLRTDRIWAAFVCSLIALVVFVSVYVHEWVDYRRHHVSSLSDETPGP